MRSGVRNRGRIKGSEMMKRRKSKEKKEERGKREIDENKGE